MYEVIISTFTGRVIRWEFSCRDEANRFVERGLPGKFLQNYRVEVRSCQPEPGSEHEGAPITGFPLAA
jgi:hypothetical protein